MLPQIETKSSVGFEVGVKKKKLVTKKNWCYRLQIDLSYFRLYQNGDELYRTLRISPVRTAPSILQNPPNY